jgi:hypothetical protein
LLKSVSLHEQRLSQTEIIISITDIEKFNFFKQYTEIKKRVDIQVKGIIQKTGESFHFHTNMFLSPLSMD